MLFESTGIVNSFFIIIIIIIIIMIIIMIMIMIIIILYISSLLVEPLSDNETNNINET